MIAPADRQNDPAEQPCLQARVQPAESSPVDDSAPGLVEFQRLDRRPSQAPLVVCAGAMFAGGNGSA